MENLMFTPNIKLEDFITDELLEKQQELSLVQYKESVARNNLCRYDYKTSKYIDGELSNEELAEVKIKRKQWREEVNEYDNRIKELKRDINILMDSAKFEYEAELQKRYKEFIERNS